MSRWRQQQRKRARKRRQLEQQRLEGAIKMLWRSATGLGPFAVLPGQDAQFVPIRD